MPIIPTNNLMDGMILSEAAVASGVELVPAGTQVDRSVVAELLKADVVRVKVTEESFGLATLVIDADHARKSRGKIQVPPPGPKTEGRHPPRSTAGATRTQANLMRVAHMFGEHREDRLMRELCRLAIKCVQEGLISV